MRASLLQLALCMCLLLPTAARADQWIVAPSREQTQAELTLELVRAGLGSSLGTVITALAGSKALASRYRLIDLDTGAVRTLSALELSLIQWTDGSGIVDAVDAANDIDQLVLVISNFGGMGTAIVTIDDGYVSHATVLSADQRLLVGEPPCDKGFAPESGFTGTTCVDIDECDAMLDDCATHATCTNTVGGHECECDEGYEGDGKMCIAPEDMPDGGMAATDGAVVMDMDGSVALDDASMPVGPTGFIAGDSCKCNVVGGQRAPSNGALMLLLSLFLATTLRLGSRRKR